MTVKEMQLKELGEGELTDINAGSGWEGKDGEIQKKRPVQHST